MAGFHHRSLPGFAFYPREKNVKKCCFSDVNSILEANCSSARELSALAGRMNSFSLAVGNATTLMTKFLNMFIVLQSSWDSKFPLPPSVKEELIFWKENVRCLNGRPIGQQFSGSRTIVYSDASDVGAGELLRVATVLFVTSLDPLTRQAAAQPGASFRRSMFTFLVFLKHYLVAQSTGLLITVIFCLSFAEVA